MDYSAIKLIASDMDGTLLDPQGKLDASFFSLFEQLDARGIHFVAASGRQYYNLLEEFHSIRDRITIIADNGGCIVHKGEELSFSTLSSDKISRIITETRKIEGIAPLLSGKKKAYIETRNPLVIAEIEKYYIRYEIVDNLLEIKDDCFFKVALYNFGDTTKNTYPRLLPLQDRNDLSVVISGNHWIDVSASGINKGVALASLQRHLSLTPEQTMTFGDQMNDLEMTQLATYSHAVANAVDPIKKAARFLIPSNAEQGVLRTLEKVISGAGQQR